MDNPTSSTISFLLEVTKLCGEKDLQTQMSEVLHLLGERSGADRCTVMLFNGGDEPIVGVYEWVEPGLQARKQHWSSAVFHELPWVMEQLKAGQPVSVPRVEDLPKAAQAERARWMALSIHSIALIPIFCEHHLGAAVIVQAENSWKTWEHEALQVLQLCGEMLLQMFWNGQQRTKAEAEATRQNEAIAKLQAELASEKQKRQEAELRSLQASDMAKMLPNAIPGILLFIDTEGRILGANEEFAQGFDRKLSDVIGARLADILPEPLMRSRWAHIQQTIESGIPCQFSDERNGKHFSNYLYPVRDPSGAVSRVGIFVTDITRQKDTESQLAEIHAQYEADQKASQTEQAGFESRRLRAMQRLRGKLLARLESLRQTELSSNQMDIILEMETFLEQAGFLVGSERYSRTERPAKKIQILLVEDNQIIADNFRSYMEAKGSQVLVALDGQAALDIAEQTWPDIVFMDISLPDMDGLEVVQKLRGMPEFTSTPIIVLTAHGNSERERCLRAGASDFLTKPVSLKNLMETAERWLRNPQGGTA